MNGQFRNRLGRAARATSILGVSASLFIAALSCNGSSEGPPLAGELVKDRNVYYGNDLSEAQKYVDFTIAIPDYLPPGYSMHHVRITSGVSSDELHLQAGFTKGPDGADGVFNFVQGPYPDVGDTWSSDEPRDLGLPFPVMYKHGSLGLWTHWEMNGVAYTMFVIGEHENHLAEVGKVITSIPYQ